jgi:hypothetical protein
MGRLKMKVKNDYVKNNMNERLFRGYNDTDTMEIIGGVSFYNKRDLITYTQDEECDWVSNITGPVKYKNLSDFDYEECLLILSLNKIPFYICLYLITKNKEWFLSNITPWE